MRYSPPAEPSDTSLTSKIRNRNRSLDQRETPLDIPAGNFAETWALKQMFTERYPNLSAIYRLPERSRVFLI